MVLCYTHSQPISIYDTITIWIYVLVYLTTSDNTGAGRRQTDRQTDTSHSSLLLLTVSHTSSHPTSTSFLRHFTAVLHSQSLDRYWLTKQYRKIHKIYNSNKPTTKKTHQNKTQSPLTTLSQETRCN